MSDDDITTFSLAEIAAKLCGDSMARPERWVLRRIRSGEFSALKVGRSYRMTPAQLKAALASLETSPPEAAVTDENVAERPSEVDMALALGLTPRSARTLRGIA